jgi:hypothetical protein
VHNAREECATNPAAVPELLRGLRTEANILDSLGRLDEALALDAELLALKPDEICIHPEVFVRSVAKHTAAGEDAKAEKMLRRFSFTMPEQWHDHHTSKTIELELKPATVLAELLERKGTEEALAEAKTLRDTIAQQIAKHAARRAALLEETRAAAAEAMRQWREEKIKAIENKKGGKGKGKKKGKKKGGKAKAKGKKSSSAVLPAIEGEPPREPAGQEVEGAAIVEGAAAAGAEQQVPVEGSESPEEVEEVMEECAICLQDLELEDDEDSWGDEGGEGEALVVLRCGHRFHAICGDMWCAKCADKGWGVSCQDVERRML